MKACRLVPVFLLLDCTEDEEPDAVNELLRELQRSFKPESCLIDYAFNDGTEKIIGLDDYDEGEAF